MVPPSPAAPAAPRWNWSELPASAAATSLTDSAAVALLARMPLLPEGPLRDRALAWLHQRGVR
jgi:hypothetical protein